MALDIDDACKKTMYIEMKNQPPGKKKSEDPETLSEESTCGEGKNRGGGG